MQQPSDRRVGGRRLYLLPLALLMVVYWICAAVYLIVDPYGIYPWSRATTVEGRFHPDDTPYLLDAVLRDHRYDILIVGGSTLVRLDAREVGAALGGRAFNLSYSGPRPRDRKLIFDRLLTQAHLRRVIVSLDWASLLDAHRGGYAFPFFLYNGTPYDDLRAVNPASLRLVAERLRVGAIVADPRSYRDYAAQDGPRRREFLSSRNLRALAAAIDDKRSRIGAGAVRPCGELAAIADLRSFARSAADRGLEVTVLIPPVSLGWFYDWVDDKERRSEIGGDPLAATLGIWRCAVTALEGIPGTKLVGFDDLAWIGGDLRNYIDLGHFGDPRIYTYIARSLDDPGRRLDSRNIDGYVRSLDVRVRGFVVDPDMASETLDR